MEGLDREAFQSKMMNDDLNRRRSTGSAGVSLKAFSEWPSTRIRKSAEWMDRQMSEKKAYGQWEVGR